MKNSKIDSLGGTTTTQPFLSSRFCEDKLKFLTTWRRRLLKTYNLGSNRASRKAHQKVSRKPLPD
jgi:hypothetical protein